MVHFDTAACEEGGSSGSIDIQGLILKIFKLYTNEEGGLPHKEKRVSQEHVVVEERMVQLKLLFASNHQLALSGA